MSNPTKDLIAKWAPLAVALFSSLVAITYSYGKLEQRLAPIEEYVRTYTHERAATNFITRPEFSTQKATRDREVDELKQALREINHKLDRLIERSTR